MCVTSKAFLALIVTIIFCSPNVIQAGGQFRGKQVPSVKEIIHEMMTSSNGLYWEARYNSRIAMLKEEAIAQMFKQKMEAVKRNENIPEEELAALLLVMRRSPSRLFTAEVETMVESSKLSTSLKVEALFTLGYLEGTSAYLKKVVSSGDDQMRAAAIDAICVGSASEQIRMLLQQHIKKGIDYTGTHTGVALSKAKSLLDTVSVYGELTMRQDRLEFLLNTVPYAHPGPGRGLPYIRFDGRGEFVMSEFRKLALEDPKSVKEALDRHAKEKGATAWLVPLLLRDLQLDAKKKLQ